MLSETTNPGTRVASRKFQRVHDRRGHLREPVDSRVLLMMGTQAETSRTGRKGGPVIHPYGSNPPAEQLTSIRLNSTRLCCSG